MVVTSLNSPAPKTIHGFNNQFSALYSLLVTYEFMERHRSEDGYTRIWIPQNAVQRDFERWLEKREHKIKITAL
jgi:hypothetical protein